VKLSTADDKLRASLLKANAPQVQTSVRVNGYMVEETMPWYAKKLQQWSKNSVYDKVRLGRDVTLSGVAIWALYKGGSIAVSWVKSLF
jgi:hypothetical protein